MKTQTIAAVTQVRAVWLGALLALETDWGLGVMPTVAAANSSDETPSGEPVALSGQQAAYAKARDYATLRARDGSEVGLARREGRGTDFRVRSREPRQVTARVQGETRTVTADVAN
jgi:hypothetical protein